MTPKFSIITINFNNLEGLQKTFQSVFSQASKDFEYIVIDGGSTDGSIELIEEYQSNVDYFVSEPDRGIYDAMNKGIAKSTGTYCLFLNSGDWLYNKDVVNRINSENTDRDILVFQMVKYMPDGIEVPTEIKEITLNRLSESSLPHQSTLVRTALLKQLGLYDLRYKIVADWAFFIRALLVENCSWQVFLYPISYFDMTGISNNTEHRELLMAERNDLKSKLLNPIIWDGGKQIDKLLSQQKSAQYKHPHFLSKLYHKIIK